jgi:subtilisin-like proprotein convertase family protein
VTRLLRPWLIVACATALFLPLQSAAAAPAPPGDGLSARARTQIDALAAAKMRRTPAQSKIDSPLLTAAQLRRGVLPAGLAIKSSVKTDASGRARIDIQGTVDAELLRVLKDRGGVVRSSLPKLNVVYADVPLAAVEPLAALRQVRRITSVASTPITAKMTRPAPLSDAEARERQVRDRLSTAFGPRPGATGPITAQSGSVVTEGDRVHAVDTARDRRRLSGIGVTVGVLSDGVDTRAASIASGDLPADLEVLPDAAGSGDEGTAMLEIVHDLAPKAKLMFATAFDGPDKFAANIRALRAAGADIIVDDVLYLGESPFQDGPIAQAVLDVTSDGALVFSSAGNDGNVDAGTSGNYETDFRPSTESVGKFAGFAHDFDPGPGVQAADPVSSATATAGGPAVLQWADALGAATDDYDLYALDAAGNVVGFSNDTQDGDDDAFEGFLLPSSAVRLAVVKFKGADRYFQLTVFGGRFRADGTLAAYATPGVTRGHSAVPAAFSVAAAPAATALPFDLEPGDPANPVGPFPGTYTGAQKAERFTSDGPRRVFFSPTGDPLTPGDFTSAGGEVRAKPDLAAADGVSTSLATFRPFFGTSAAAPHAAAVAALMVSGSPGITPQRVRAALVDTARDIEGTGYDQDTGAGLIRARAAVAAVRVRPQPYARPDVPVVTSSTDGDAFLEPGETGTVQLPVTNIGDAPSRRVSASVTSPTAGVTVTPASRSYGTIPAEGSRSRNFIVSVARDKPLGSVVVLASRVAFAGAYSPVPGSGEVVLGEPSSRVVTAAYAGPPLPIPDNLPNGVTVPLALDSSVGTVSEVTFSVDGTECSDSADNATAGISHTFVGDLVGTLTGPDGTAVQVFDRAGSTGNNYCQTVFTDAAARSISSAQSFEAPFTGDWQPSQPFTRFRGGAGDGTWSFQVADRAGSDAGTLRAVSLHVRGYVPPPG